MEKENKIMSEFKGTKGKWEILIGNHIGNLITAENGNKNICTVWGNEIEDLHNVKLISLAKEILKFLYIIESSENTQYEHRRKAKELIKEVTE